MKIRKKLWGIAYAVMLTCFSLYILLDTFVISEVYSVAETEKETVQEQTEPAEETAGGDILSTASSYQDENISVTLTRYREYDSDIYVAEVWLSSADYLKTAFAQEAFGRNVTETASAIAQSSNAILAINGDNYGSQENGYVLRNGVIYRDTASRNREDLVIWEDGSFTAIEEGTVSAEELLAGGARQILSFGPALVTEGSISVTADQEVGKAKASNPRTAIAIAEPLHYFFVVSDGRTEESTGLSLYELAQFLQSLGAVTAYNLDGGGSSTMYFQGEVVNNPTSNGRTIKERSVSDIVCIGY